VHKLVTRRQHLHAVRQHQQITEIFDLPLPERGNLRVDVLCALATAAPTALPVMGGADEIAEIEAVMAIDEVDALICLSASTSVSGKRSVLP
jgi:hypothetical protein